MVTVTVIKDDGNKRILRCSEGNRVWYQLWITDLDMAMLEKYYLDLIEKKLIKSWWLRNLQVWYVFFYEKKNGEIKASMRSNEAVNVSEIAVRFGGGGHIRASGCTLYGSFEEVMPPVINELKKALEV